MVLVEIVANDLCQIRLTSTRLTYYYGIGTEAHLHDVFARM